MTLLAQEARPEEAEVKSEAAFQRLVASVSDLPIQPRTPRPVDRGRYPEEAGKEEEATREDTPSDDDEQEKTEEVPFVFNPPATATQPINIQRPSSRTITPAGSVAGSVNGDDTGMSISETSSSFGTAMDVDMESYSVSFARFPTDFATSLSGLPCFLRLINGGIHLLQQQVVVLSGLTSANVSPATFIVHNIEYPHRVS